MGKPVSTHVGMNLLRLLVVTLLATLLAASNVGVSQAATGDAVADHVLGQNDLNSGLANQGGGPTPSTLYNPWHLVVDQTAGRVYVGDQANHRILGWNNISSFANGAAAIIEITTDGIVGGFHLNTPRAMVVDAAGNLFVTDTYNQRVLMFRAPITSTVNGMQAYAVFGQPDFVSNAVNQSAGATAQTLNGPSDVTVDKNGNLYVADNGNNRVLKYNTPLTTTLANRAADSVVGQATFTDLLGNRGGVPSAQTVWQPFGIATDSTNNLYVADSYNNRVLRFSSALPATNATANLVIGQQNYSANSSNQGNALPTASTLFYPYGVTLDSANNLYVADQNNNRVLEYSSPLTTPNLAATMVLGQSGFGTNTFGTTNIMLNFPNGVAVDSAMNVWVADTNNNRVVKYDTPLLKFRLMLPYIRK